MFGVALIVHTVQTKVDPNTGKYVSKSDGFAIKFRTPPKIDHANVTNASTGDSIPQTTYETASQNGKAAYAVAVVHYPKSYTFTLDSLKKVAESQAKHSTTGKLLTESYVHYLGQNTLESSYETLSDGKTYTVYGISLAKDHKLYTVYAIGASKQDFSNFVKTFSFTN